MITEKQECLYLVAACQNQLVTLLTVQRDNMLLYLRQCKNRLRYLHRHVPSFTDWAWHLFDNYISTITDVFRERSRTWCFWGKHVERPVRPKMEVEAVYQPRPLSIPSPLTFLLSHITVLEFFFPDWQDSTQWMFTFSQELWRKIAFR